MTINGHLWASVAENITKPEEIDWAFDASEADMERFHKALDCYVTSVDVIAATKIHEVFGKDVHFEIFREDHKPPLRGLFGGLRDRPPVWGRPPLFRGTRVTDVRRIHSSR